MEATAVRTSPVRTTILSHVLRTRMNNLRPSQAHLPSRVCKFSEWRKMKQNACCYAAAKDAGGFGSSPAGSVKRTESVAGAGKVSAVLFDMDGVLCNSEEPSRQAAVDVFAEMGVQVTTADFVPFMGTGEANFLGGVARDKGIKGFDPLVAKKRFFEIYLEKYARPNSGLGYPGSLELILQCKNQGLKVAVASSADRIKVDANLAAAGLPQSIFDAIISADAFNNLKPAPDIFLAAARMLNVPPNECVVIEDALAGVQAANAAKMRCIAVTTTLPKEKLVPVGPSLIRKDIGNISLHDIMNSGRSDEINQGGYELEIGMESSLEASQERNSVGFIPDIQSVHDADIFLPGGLQASRRDVLRLGSLGIAICCSLVAVTHWKAISYTSPKGILNALIGVDQPRIAQNDSRTDMSQSARLQQFKNYISDMETRGAGQEVPEFPSKLDWLNANPLRLKRDLRGKVVILDFWTYCCVNCMHVLPDLEYLEKKYKGKPFSVIGVHSAKFDNEKDLGAIRNAVLRYEITHPVVNDGDMILWRQLGVNSWPTFVVVSPNGKLLAHLAGEGHRKDLDDLVESALQYYGEKKLLDNRPIPQLLEKDKDTRLLSSPLKFPGKLATDLTNNRLFISDSNHHRIVVTDLEGNFIMQIGGTGEEVLRDGAFEYAAFNRPQGLAYNPKKDVLYVADTENHALREIDFVNQNVRTLAGNGEKGSDYKGGKKGMSQVLNSPWDVCIEPSTGILYIAMAGQHQIWEHNILDGITRAFSGDGYERNLNGQSSTSTSFAQPSGISLSSDMKELYVADSESSSIRAVNVKTGGSRILAGGDPLFADNLFKFGDHDGVGTDAQFQHPLGVLCSSDGLVYIADSYNHKIKVMDPVSRKVSTLAGTGSAGFKDGSAQSAQLSEPAGIAQGGKGKFFVADTNNNVIRLINFKRGDVPMVHTLELKGVEAPSGKPKSPKRLQRRPPADTQLIRIEPISAMKGDLLLEILLPSEFHFTKEAASKFEAEVEPNDGVLVEPMDGILNSDGSALLHFERFAPNSATVRVNCKVYYCKEDEVCLYQALAFEVPFSSDSISSSTAEAMMHSHRHLGGGSISSEYRGECRIRFLTSRRARDRY